MKHFLFILFMFSFFGLFAQNKSDTQPDIRLLEVYPAEKLDYLQNNNPVEIVFLNFKLDNSYLIEEASSITLDMSSLKRVFIDDLNSFNFFKLNIIPQNNERTFFLIDGTSKVLVVKSDGEVSAEFKSSFKK